MSDERRTLWEVFPEAFPEELRELATTTYVGRVDICQHSQQIDVQLVADAQLDAEKQAMIAACLDIWLEGRLQVVLHQDKAPKTLENVTDEQKKNKLLQRLRQSQPASASVLAAAQFEFTDGHLAIRVRPAVLPALTLRKTGKTLERILKELGLPCSVELIGDAQIEERRRLRRSPLLLRRPRSRHCRGKKRAGRSRRICRCKTQSSKKQGRLKRRRAARHLRPARCRSRNR